MAYQHQDPEFQGCHPSVAVEDAKKFEAIRHLFFLYSLFFCYTSKAHVEITGSTEHSTNSKMQDLTFDCGPTQTCAVDTKDTCNSN